MSLILRINDFLEWGQIVGLEAVDGIRGIDWEKVILDPNYDFPSTFLGLDDSIKNKILTNYLISFAVRGRLDNTENFNVEMIIKLLIVYGKILKKIFNNPEEIDMVFKKIFGQENNYIDNWLKYKYHNTVLLWTTMTLEQQKIFASFVMILIQSL